MTAAKRAITTITDAELAEVSHLTYRDAADTLGIGSTATVRLLYQKRGVPRIERRPGELAEYHTRAPYKLSAERKRNGTLGLKSNGEYVEVFWSVMDEEMAKRLGLSRTCRDLGTPHCLKHCELEIALPNCDFKCGSCEYEQKCPCSLHDWLKRQEEVE